MKKLIWIFCVALSLLNFACSGDDVEDTTGYYFKAVENKENQLPASVDFMSRGGTFEVMFDTGQSWTASLQEDNNWVHMSSSEGNAGINTVVLTIDPNTNNESRSATVLILAKTVGKRIIINQEGVQGDNPGEKIADRTVLAYMAAENSLSPYAISDVMEMVQGANAIPENNHLLVYLDDDKYPRIYEISKNEIGLADTIRVRDFQQEMDSADPSTLENVLLFMKENYKSEEYGLVMWSHGDGWIPGTTRFIGIDNNINSSHANSGSLLGVDQLKQAIGNTIGSVNYIFFDACFMMTSEVAYELKDCCHYIIASPCEIPAPGAPYQFITASLFDKEISRGEIARTYYQYYKEGKGNDTVNFGVVLATIDCTQMEQFADVTSNMVKTYFSPETVANSKSFIQYGFGSVGGYSRDNMYLDMKSVMRSVLDDACYEEWAESLNKMLIAFDSTDFWYASNPSGIRRLDVSRACGIAMTLPLLITDSSELKEYYKLSWYSRVWK